MTTYIVAVSGGVDSVVLLDMLASGKLLDGAELVVAHFDHGIRPDSADDATFVRQLATDYGLLVETRRQELGAGASEELARERRYAFLREVAAKHGGQIVTAHHADDVIETIAINLKRGTGWRGLAVLDSPDITRPLLNRTKAELFAYARQHKLVWHEDSTNADTKYLRNDIRQRLTRLNGESLELLRLYRERQVYLKRDIDAETAKLIGESPYRRHEFIVAPESAALELLRAVLVRETGTGLTRPLLARALHAIKTFHPGKSFVVSRGVSLRFTKTHFSVDT